jgi:hypothetical protein
MELSEWVFKKRTDKKLQLKYMKRKKLINLTKLKIFKDK